MKALLLSSEGKTLLFEHFFGSAMDAAVEFESNFCMVSWSKFRISLLLIADLWNAEEYMTKVME